MLANDIGHLHWTYQCLDLANLHHYWHQSMAPWRHLHRDGKQIHSDVLDSFALLVGHLRVLQRNKTTCAVYNVIPVSWLVMRRQDPGLIYILYNCITTFLVKVKTLHAGEIREGKSSKTNLFATKRFATWQLPVQRILGHVSEFGRNKRFTSNQSTHWQVHSLLLRQEMARLKSNWQQKARSTYSILTTHTWSTIGTHA